MQLPPEKLATHRENHETFQAAEAKIRSGLGENKMSLDVFREPPEQGEAKESVEGKLPTVLLHLNKSLLASGGSQPPFNGITRAGFRLAEARG